MSQQSINAMKKISLGKIVLNIGLGKSGEAIDIASNALAQITNRKPNARNAKKSQRDWGVRKGEPIGVIVTVRGEDATILLKRLLQAVNNQIKEKSFDNEGNISFGIKEHIDIPDIKYDPNIGILGLEVAASLTRPGFNVKLRSKRKSKIGRNHRITKHEAQEFFTKHFGVTLV